MDDISFLTRTIDDAQLIIESTDRLLVLSKHLIFTILCQLTYANFSLSSAIWLAAHWIRLNIEGEGKIYQDFFVFRQQYKVEKVYRRAACWAFIPRWNKSEEISADCFNDKFGAPRREIYNAREAWAIISKRRKCFGGNLWVRIVDERLENWKRWKKAETKSTEWLFWAVSCWVWLLEITNRKLLEQNPVVFQLLTFKISAKAHW